MILKKIYNDLSAHSNRYTETGEWDLDRVIPPQLYSNYKQVLFFFFLNYIEVVKSLKLFRIFFRIAILDFFFHSGLVCLFR